MVLAGNRLRFGLYVGEGASHSWTWFVDLLEAYGCRRMSFLDERDFSRKAREQDVLLLSGGDTFAVARALKPGGPEAIHAFLDRGGLYIGSCAGAYLPLYSSKEPLCAFNFVRSRINNLTRDLPPAQRMASKFSHRYGCDYVVHPVREDVRVRMAEGFPVWGGKEIRVPLYGGPPLQASGDAVTQAVYSGFTDRTLFLTHREVAERVYLGQGAACEKRIGRGRMVLLGPHFEHPWFPEGNDVIYQWLRAHARPGQAGGPAGGAEAVEEGAARPAGEAGAAWLRAFKQEVSNMRIRAAALARESVHWQIGAKTYEPEKILVFLDAVWRRLKRVPVGARPALLPGEEEDLLKRAGDCHRELRRLTEEVRSQRESEPTARRLFPALRQLAAGFLECYFRQPPPGPAGGARAARGRCACR